MARRRSIERLLLGLTLLLVTTYRSYAGLLSGRPISCSTSTIDAAAPPDWQRVASTPRFSWIEPRAQAPTDESTPARYLWEVPMQIGDDPIRVRGELTWRSVEAQKPAAALASAISTR